MIITGTFVTGRVVWDVRSQSYVTKDNQEEPFMVEYDYDSAPTDPRHGGKMTAEQAAERIAELEAVIRDFIALERVQTPDMSGRKRTYAFMRNGPALAAVLDAARALVEVP